MDVWVMVGTSHGEFFSVFSCEEMAMACARETNARAGSEELGDYVRVFPVTLNATFKALLQRTAYEEEQKLQSLLDKETVTGWVLGDLMNDDNTFHSEGS